MRLVGREMLRDWGSGLVPYLPDLSVGSGMVPRPWKVLLRKSVVRVERGWAQGAGVALGFAGVLVAAGMIPHPLDARPRRMCDETNGDESGTQG